MAGNSAAATEHLAHLIRLEPATFEGGGTRSDVRGVREDTHAEREREELADGTAAAAAKACAEVHAKGSSSAERW